MSKHLTDCVGRVVVHTQGAWPKGIRVTRFRQEQFILTDVTSHMIKHGAQVRCSSEDAPNLQNP